MNPGSENSTRMIAIKVAKLLSKIDSKINWAIRSFLNDPRVLRIPTSLALPDECAVDKLTKFIHAITKTKKAIAVKTKTY